jgi:hypothetical protein
MPETPMPLRLEYSVSREQYIAGMRETMQVMLRFVRWGAAMYWLSAASVACGIGIGMGYVELINGYIGRNWRLQWLIAVVFLIVCLLTIWLQRMRAARIYATCAVDGNMMLGAQSLTLEAEGLTHETSHCTTRIAWPALRQVLLNDDKILIIFDNYLFWVVPAQAFSDAAQRQAWIESLRARAPGE